VQEEHTEQEYRREGAEGHAVITEIGDDISMLGQFGVGFYFDYLVVIMTHVASEHGDDR